MITADEQYRQRLRLAQNIEYEKALREFDHRLENDPDNSDILYKSLHQMKKTLNKSEKEKS